MTTKEVIQHFGSLGKVGAALGISAQAVFKWGEQPPLLRQFQLQVVTNNQLTIDGGAIDAVAAHR